MRKDRCKTKCKPDRALSNFSLIIDSPIRLQTEKLKKHNKKSRNGPHTFLKKTPLNASYMAAS